MSLIRMAYSLAGRRHPSLEVDPDALPESRITKKLRHVGALCFDYLTSEVEWSTEHCERKKLRMQFIDAFISVIQDVEGRRYLAGGNRPDYGTITIGLSESEKLHYYLERTRDIISASLSEGEVLPTLRWPRSTIIRIEFYPARIKVEVRDPHDPFRQSLGAARRRVRMKRYGRKSELVTK